MWRVRGQATFQRLRTAPRVRQGPLTVTWASGLGSHSDDPPRVAFAIGRRAGGAVVRNRLRRRLRELARASALPGGAWLVSAGPAAGTASFSELRTWWDAAVDELVRRATAGAR